MSYSHNKMATAFKGLSVSSQVIGENGAPMEKSTGSRVMDLNHSVDQSTSSEDIGRFLDSVLQNATTAEEIKDLVITIINKRHPRDGEGCKDTGFELLLQLYEKGYPQLVISLMEFVPEFGCIKDWWKILALINKRLTASGSKMNEGYYNLYNPLVEAIMSNFWNYIDTDLQIYGDWKEKYSELSEEDLMERKGEIQFKLSTAGKYAPREKGSEDRTVFWWIPIYNEESGMVVSYQKQQLRKMLIRWKYQPFKESKFYVKSGVNSIQSRFQKSARLNFALLNRLCDICEVKTCSGRWRELKPESAPSKFLMKNRKAWLNEAKGKVPLTTWQMETGNRYPEDTDRVEARKILLAGLSKVKGGVLAPYEFIQKIKSRGISLTEMKVLEAQWKSMIAEVRKNIKEYIRDLRVKALIAEGKEVDEDDLPEVTDADIEEVLVMIDVSGSMDCEAAKGITCMDLAISLGIVASELNTGAFKNMALSFSMSPRLFYFVHSNGREYSLIEKYNEIMREVGYNTNVGAAMDLILSVAKKEGMSEEELPSMLILSDGQFDVQVVRGPYDYSQSATDTSEKWNTSFDTFTQKFQTAGYSRAPMINFWNLNARFNSPRTYGYQAQEDRPGVSMIQGWNNASFKMVMSGQEVIASDSKKKGTSSMKTAMDDFMGMINQNCYVWIKEILSASEEGLLKDYTYLVADEGEKLRTLETLSRKIEVEGCDTDTELMDVVEASEVEACEAEAIADTVEAMIETVTDTVKAMEETVAETGAPAESSDEKPKTWGQTLFGSWGGYGAEP